MKSYFQTSWLARHVIIISVALLPACQFTTKPKTLNGPTSETDSLPALPKYHLPGPGKISTAEIERIGTACEAWYNQSLAGTVFNGGILVAQKGTILFEKYRGSLHPGGNDTINANTVFHIASVSKTFTAMAILKLCQEGKLQLDEELSHYFPSFNYPGVTLRCLLSHRSGLPNYVYFLEKLGWPQNQFARNQDVMDYLIYRKIELTDISPACTRFSYCNTNYAVLALLIEKVTGISYPAYMKQNFFDPLAMDHSFVLSAKDSAKATPSFDWRGNAIPLNYLDFVYGDKNIFSTARDLLKWDRFLSSGLLFTKETLQEAYMPYSNEHPGIKNYGLGWRMNIYDNGKKIIFHNGWWHGNNAAFIRLLDEDVTIIALNNRFTRATYHVNQLANLFSGYFIPVDDETDAASKDSLLKSNTDSSTIHHKNEAKTPYKAPAKKKKN
ncbi:MAG: beta-lactamase family protein [Bacteroidetes bacterium]|nr:beta-lactamase family protein [Bacteroidota bacterium]MBS1924620.1 beta-lactamase family protein [Bacteroidota bacterium]MCC6692420.1 beta-lactamase family protein [Chitinophagaceae bacterium]HRD43312.1 serine hydrolase domain-containing protein [Ferruginibacter sp.]